MKLKKYEELKRHTTFRMGGIAVNYFIPENISELVELNNKEKNARYIGGGSNLLISDHMFDVVIDLGEFDQTILPIGRGRFKVGASVRLQKLINVINENGYGGIEYLYSVPGLVGGAIVMNAGRGQKYNKCISDYIVSVDVLCDGKMETLPKEDCQFEYRDSIFKDSDMIVTSVLFQFPQMSISETNSKKEERIRLCKEKQDSSKPNFGSVFSECSGSIMKMVKAVAVRTGGCHYSTKTSNWLLNDGGTFEDAIDCIQKVELLHRFFCLKCKTEVIIWK